MNLKPLEECRQYKYNTHLYKMWFVNPYFQDSRLSDLSYIKCAESCWITMGCKRCRKQCFKGISYTKCSEPCCKAMVYGAGLCDWCQEVEEEEQLAYKYRRFAHNGEEF